MGRRLDSVHLEASRIEHWSLVPVKTKSLIAVLIALLELVIRGRAGAAENGQDVPPEACLVKRTISFALGELVRVHEFSRRFATGHQEDVISHERGGVEKANDSQDNQGQRNAEVVDGFGKGNVFLVHVNNELCKTCADQVEGEDGGR